MQAALENLLSDFGERGILVLQIESGFAILQSVGKIAKILKARGNKIMKCKKLSKVASLLLAMLLLTSAFAMPAAAAGPFTDVSEKAWYYEAVEYACSHGLFEGTSATAFSPERPMTRAMFVQVLANKTKNYVKADWAGKSSFDDVKAGSWYEPAVSWANRTGLVDGMGPRSFAPLSNVTREQMAVILYNYAKTTGNDVSRNESALSAFPDASSVSGWAREAMQWAVSHSIIGGSNGLLKPKNSARRCEVAQVFRAADSVLVKTDVPIPDPTDPQLYANLEAFGNSPEGKEMLTQIAAAVNAQIPNELRVELDCVGNSLIYIYMLTVDVDTSGLAEKLDQATDQLEESMTELLLELEEMVAEPNPTVILYFEDINGNEIYSCEFYLE